MWGYSMLGGALMLAIGVLYLIFEEKLLSKSKIAEDSTAPADNTLSRALIGIQVSCSDIALCDVSDRNRLAS
jgi:phosphatidylinositol glycan class N